MIFFSLVGPVAVFAGLYAAQAAYDRPAIETRQAIVESVPRVQVCSVTRSAPTKSIRLMGEAAPYVSVTLYSKVSGYLKEIRVDKGDKVSAGDLLAVVESPELDQRWDAAVADAKDKRLDAGRGEMLIKTGSISQQQLDHLESAAAVAEAKAASLKTMKDYQEIRAPFAGLITARYADPGALVQQAVQQESPALPLVTLAETNRLRVYVYPHQKIAAYVKPGDRAEIWDEARPQIKATGTVDRTSGEIDPKTRTLLVEIDVDNKDMHILPGSFVQVALHVQPEPTLEVPVGALVTRGDKHLAAVVRPDNTLSFCPVNICDSDGKIAKIDSGLKEGERVALNVGDSVADGHRVQPVREVPD